MKLIHAVIQPHKLTDVKQSLAKAGVTKMTVTSATRLKIQWVKVRVG